MWHTPSHGCVVIPSHPGAASLFDSFLFFLLFFFLRPLRRGLFSVLFCPFSKPSSVPPTCPFSLHQLQSSNRRRPARAHQSDTQSRSTSHASYSDRFLARPTRRTLCDRCRRSSTRVRQAVGCSRSHVEVDDATTAVAVAVTVAAVDFRLPVRSCPSRQRPTSYTPHHPPCHTVPYRTVPYRAIPYHTIPTIPKTYARPVVQPSSKHGTHVVRDLSQRQQRSSSRQRNSSPLGLSTRHAAVCDTRRLQTTPSSAISAPRARRRRSIKSAPT